MNHTAVLTLSSHSFSGTLWVWEGEVKVNVSSYEHWLMLFYLFFLDFWLARKKQVEIGISQLYRCLSFCKLVQKARFQKSRYHQTHELIQIKARCEVTRRTSTKRCYLTFLVTQREHQHNPTDIPTHYDTGLPRVQAKLNAIMAHILNYQVRKALTLVDKHETHHYTV